MKQIKSGKKLALEMQNILSHARHLRSFYNFFPPNTAKVVW